MKARNPEITDQPFDITPMIDIVFLLITFFMVVAAAITEKVPIEVPQAEQSKSPEETKGRIEVSIDSHGELYSGIVKISDEQFASLIEENRDTPGFRLYVRADASAEHADIRRVMNLAADNQVFSIIFATLRE